mgnify:CR=1 FL=1
MEVGNDYPLKVLKLCLECHFNQWSIFLFGKKEEARDTPLLNCQPISVI